MKDWNEIWHSHKRVAEEAESIRPRTLDPARDLVGATRKHWRGRSYGTGYDHALKEHPFSAIKLG